MSSQIPADFGSEWEMSDVVLLTENSDGKELHANKSLLAIFSSYFHGMFFGNFKEATENSLNLHCDYTALKEILRIVHLVGRDYTTNGQKQYEPKMLREMYTVADMLLFSDVKKLCEDQMMDRPSVEMANAAHSLGLHAMMINILTKLDWTSVRNFISEDNKPNLGPNLFSRKDLKFFSVKIKSFGASSSFVTKHDLEPPKPALNLEEIFKDLEEPRIDLTKKWPMRDVSLLTKNSLGRVLYRNKAYLACLSEYFQKMFFENTAKKDWNLLGDSSEDEAVIQLDAEYATVKQILQIIHHCNTDSSRAGYVEIHPVLLYDMYLTASEDQLNIPMIKKICCDNLLDQQGLIAYEVAIRLGIDDIKSKLVNSLSSNDTRKWMMSDEDEVVYLRGGKEVVITASSEEEVLSVDDLRVMCGRL